MDRVREDDLESQPGFIGLLEPWSGSTEEGEDQTPDQHANEQHDVDEEHEEYLRIPSPMWLLPSSSPSTPSPTNILFLIQGTFPTNDPFFTVEPFPTNEPYLTESFIHKGLQHVGQTSTP